MYTANTGGSTGALAINSVLTGTVAAGSVALTLGGTGSGTSRGPTPTPATPT